MQLNVLYILYSVESVLYIVHIVKKYAIPPSCLALSAFPRSIARASPSHCTKCSAKAALGTSVSVPTPTSVVVNAPGAYQRIPPPPPPSDPASDSAGLIIAVAGIVGMICCVLMVGRCMRESISDAKAEMERNRANALPCVAQEATPKNSPALFPVTPPGQHLPAMELQGDGGPSQLSGMVPSGAPN